MIGFGKLSFDKVRPGVMVLELIVIVLGISASFWVDEWREKKQDTETFNRIIGEVYYGLALDDNKLMFDAAANSRAAVLAADLILKDKPLPDVEEIYERINTLFHGQPIFQIADGAYERLVNSSLAIPTNQTQVALDRGYSRLRRQEEGILKLYTRLLDLAEKDWFSHGILPCRELNEYVRPENDGRDLWGMSEPMMFAVRNEEGECHTEASNHEITLRLIETESFRTTILRALNLRQQLAEIHRNARGFVESTRSALVKEHPFVTMPIQSIKVSTWPKNGGVEGKSDVQLQRAGPVEWQGTVTLIDGYSSFHADDGFTMFWGRRPSWLWRTVAESVEFEAEEISWFPSNIASFRGHGIESVPGTYEVYFNSQTYEYRFEEIVQ